MSGKYILYYRCSTQRQGQSGLGLEAQQQQAKQYLNLVGGTLVQEFTEIESGRKNDRPQVQAAIELCRVHDATLLVAKFDRLSRDAAVLLGLKKSEVRFIAADNPSANELTVGILAIVAEAEAKAVSERTKAALAPTRARGTVLGGYRGYSFTKEDYCRAAESRTEKANEKAERLKPVLNRVNPDGSLSFGKVASVLNIEGVPTISGKGQ